MLGESQGIEFTGETILTLKKPCVYIWFRGDDALYVGKSANGFERVLDRKHHRMSGPGLIEILPDDRVVVWPVETVEIAESLERLAIRAFSPRYNRTNGALTRLVSRDLGVSVNRAKVLIRQLSSVDQVASG